MRLPEGIKPVKRPAKGKKPSRPKKPPVDPNVKRDRYSYALGVLTLAGVVAAFIFTSGTSFLMPGPLTSVHGTIEDCKSCHTETGAGKVSWLHGLIAPNPKGDSKACLVCHKMLDTAFNSHSASQAQLKASTSRLTKVAAEIAPPQSKKIRDIAFPMAPVMQGEVYCATCHQEHHGVDFDLNKISNAQCQSCHVVQFDNFDGNHPKFSNYPFERRTRVIYDHNGHFKKHYPEVQSKKDHRLSAIPATCSDCHTSKADRRHMAVVPFDNTCSSCHLDQIVGKERATGPKGIAYLSLPGLDVETLKSKNAAIGEWPEFSEAELTPFMKVLIAADEPGRALIKRIGDLDLQDLSQASDDDIAAVTNFVWKVKGLFYALVSGRASDVMARLEQGTGAKVRPQIIADLTASIPRDVITAAQREWLPNLGDEIANRKEAAQTGGAGWTSAITESKLSASVRSEDLAARERFVIPLASGSFTSPKAEAGDADRPVRLAQAEIKKLSKEEEKDIQSGSWRVDPFGRLIKDPNEVLPPPNAENSEADAADADAGADPAAESDSASDTAADTDAEADSDIDTAATGTAPAGSIIQSEIDPESWAEYGGWYRQDYAIFYRPVGHKDKFIYSWLELTGPQAPRGGVSPSAAVFDSLTTKDAQGQCAKCHSIDDIRGKGRRVNFSPASIETKRGRFTNFIHEPHYGVLENRGCLVCHALDKGTQYLTTYKKGDTQSFVSNFTPVKKDLCQTCHNKNEAKQDCLLCHKYHVNEVITPIMTTRIPVK
jgi:hypothetical protein